MIRIPFGVALLCAACAACSSSSSDPSGAESTAGNSGNSSCPDVSGEWNIADHCDSSFIGMSLQVTENACALAVSAPFDAFSGSVSADGKITLSGPLTCTGTATTSAISMNCTPGPCMVRLAR